MTFFPPPFPTSSSLAELCEEIKTIGAYTREVGPWKSGALSKIATLTVALRAGFIKDDGGTEASEKADHGASHRRGISLPDDRTSPHAMGKRGTDLISC